jgi:methylmalonyl-CoA mutase cobalamin-binding domain/chain
MANEIYENLAAALKKYDKEGIADLAKKAVEEKADPLKAMDALTVAIREVGDAFEKEELWLPDLIGAAAAMQCAMPILEEEIVRTGSTKTSIGTFVIGTVFGDIHSIGITMVSTLAIAAGFDVHNLGINVKAEDFVNAVKEKKADILGLSALLTLTMAEQKKVIDLLKEEGIREQVKVIIGGGAITQDFADSIGADGYSPTAPGGVEWMREIVKSS